MANAVVKHQHPYTLEQAREIRKRLILEPDKEKRVRFLEELVEKFQSKAPEILAYIGNDYRVMVRDDQLWNNFQDPSWTGQVFCCGRAWGKALRDDQLVKTPTGWRAIGTLKVGDKISNVRGGVQSVTGVYPQGVVSLFEITTQDGRKSVACKDHLWTGRLGNKLTPTEDLSTLTTQTLYEEYEKGKRFYLPTVTSSEDNLPDREYKIDPYVVGLLLGDGGMTKGDTLTISTRDKEVVSAIREAGYTVNKYKNSKYDHGVSGNGIFEELGRLELSGVNSHTKFIPPDYLLGSLDQRTEVLRGLMDTDGYVETAGKRIEYATVSTQLAEQVRQLCWSMGYKVKLTLRTTTCEGKRFESYRLRITGGNLSNLFKLPRHRSRAVLCDTEASLRVVSIKPVQSDAATCISVSDPSRLFVTNNYLVTHNTWSGSPACIEYAMQHPDCRIGLIAPTFGMGRTNMLEGSSGIIKLSPKGFKPKYNRSDGTLEWPNGSTAKLFSAENGDRIRGENFHYVWVDEFCFCKFTNADDDFWKMAKFALRKGACPKYTITTSPRPIKALKDLYEDSEKEGSKVRFRTGTTYDNYTLPQSFIDDVDALKGTSIYDQEILGKILEENLGAIFVMEDIKRVDLIKNGEDPEDYDVRFLELLESMDSIVVAVDPNVIEDEESDETGIVVAGRKGIKGYVFKDESRRGRLKDIYQTVVDLYWLYQADCVVVEVNNGGDFIPLAIHNIDEFVTVESVHASRSKRSRAEPIGLLYQRGQVYHVGVHKDLEVQMTNYNPQVDKKSPDRMDAMVWALVKLFPKTMKGLYGDRERSEDNSGVDADVYGHQKEKAVEDLYQELLERRDGAYTLDYGSGDDLEEDLSGSAYSIFD